MERGWGWYAGWSGVGGLFVCGVEWGWGEWGELDRGGEEGEGLRAPEDV